MYFNVTKAVPPGEMLGWFNHRKWEWHIIYVIHWDFPSPNEYDCWLMFTHLTSSIYEPSINSVTDNLAKQGLHVVSYLHIVQPIRSLRLETSFRVPSRQVAAGNPIWQGSNRKFKMRNVLLAQEASTVLRPTLRCRIGLGWLCAKNHVRQSRRKNNILRFVVKMEFHTDVWFWVVLRKLSS